MNKTALITGASTGIGRELAKIHASTGGDLVIVARSTDKLNQLKSELETQYHVKVHVISKDLTLLASCYEVYEEVKAAGIEIDFLINNAGFGGLGKFHERKLADDLAMINLNIVALTVLTHLFLSDFVKRGSGKVLNVSSTASLMAGPLQAVYFATKAFVTSFSNAIAEELSGTGVTVTALMPGATKTEFGKVSGLDNTPLFDNLYSAEGVAKEGYEGMLAGKLDVITGVSTMQKLMLKAIPFTPKRVVLKQTRKLQETKK